MIYKGIYQKQPEMVKFMILLFVSFIVGGVLERLLGVDQVTYSFWEYHLLSILIDVLSFLLLGFIYYKTIKKKKEIKE